MQTGPKDCLHQCGNKRLCRLGVTPSISTLGSQMSEAPFCLYAACLLIEILHTGHSRLIPHQWKGCLGPVWAVGITPGAAPACLCSNCMLRARRCCARQQSMTLRWRSSRLRSQIVYGGRRSSSSCVGGMEALLACRRARWSGRGGKNWIRV